MPLRATESPSACSNRVSPAPGWGFSRRTISRMVVGQPVLIPGSMGTASYVLTGVPGGDAFFSTCHGAGRTQSRHQAVRSVDVKELRKELTRQGVRVRGSSARGLAEEAPIAYKDVDAVVEAAEGAGLCRKVARLVPLGVVKG